MFARWKSPKTAELIASVAADLGTLIVGIVAASAGKGAIAAAVDTSTARLRINIE